MANAALTLGTSAVNLRALPVRVAAGFLKAKRNYGKIIEGCNHDAANELSQGAGRVVNVILASMPASVPTLTDGSAVVLDDTVENGVPVTLDTFRTANIQLTEVFRTLTVPAALDSLIAGRTAGLLNAVESDVAAAGVLGFTTNVVGGFGAGLNEAVLIAASRKLAENWTPEFPWNGYLSVKGTYELAAVPRATEAQMVGRMTEDAPVVSGAQPGYNFQGATYRMTQALGSLVYSDAIQTDNLLFHPDALLFASRPVGPGLDLAPLGVIAQSFDLDGVWYNVRIGAINTILGEQVSITSLYGVTPGREVWGVYIKG